MTEGYICSECIRWYPSWSRYAEHVGETHEGWTWDGETLEYDWSTADD